MSKKRQTVSNHFVALTERLREIEGEIINTDNIPIKKLTLLRKEFEETADTVKFLAYIQSLLDKEEKSESKIVSLQ